MENIIELLFNILLLTVGAILGIYSNKYPNTLLKVSSYVLIALISFWIGYRYQYNQQQLQFHVDNKLSQTINVYANDEFHGSVAPGEIGTFSRLSLQDFPLTVRWTVKKTYSFGHDMGETISRVDSGRTIIVDNQVGESTYFYPVITSAVDEDCQISINDGTQDEARAGILRANFNNVTPGYFILSEHSNVTLYCNNRPMWYGERNGNDVGWHSGDVEAGNGNLLLVFYNP